MVKMAEKMTPAKKYNVYAAAIATADSVVDNNYKKGNYKDMASFPLGAAYVYATNARGKILQAFQDAQFFTSYEKGVPCLLKYVNMLPHIGHMFYRMHL